MKERWYYFKTKFDLKVVKWLAKPYRWAFLHIPAERRLKHFDQLYAICDELEKLEDDFPEARMIRIRYLFIGLAVAIDGIKRLDKKYPQLAKNN